MVPTPGPPGPPGFPAAALIGNTPPPPALSPQQAAGLEAGQPSPRGPGAAVGRGPPVPPAPGEGEADVQAKIADRAEDDRAIAARIHELVLAAAPGLVPRTFYGMPAYAKDGKVICFFQAKSKFKVRYSTLGFQPDARLDKEEMWP